MGPLAIVQRELRRASRDVLTFFAAPLTGLGLRKGRPDAAKDDDAQLRALRPSQALERALRRGNPSRVAVIERILACYADRPALGERACEIVPDGSGRPRRRHGDDFTTISYGDLREKVTALAGAWTHHDTHRVAAGEFIGIFGFAGIDLTIADLACAYVGAVVVPLQAGMAPADLEAILRETGPAALLAPPGDLGRIVPLAIAQPGLRCILVIEADDRDADDRERIAAARAAIAGSGAALSLVTLDDLLAFGRGARWTLQARRPPDDAVAGLIYTSGSTGRPRGLVLSERAMRQSWIDATATRRPQVTLSYTPMNHVIGRAAVFLTLARGGTVCFTLKSDLSTLFQDIRTVRPTDLFFLPRVAQSIHRFYLDEVARRTGAGIARAEAEVKQEMRATFLGDRIRRGTVGSAPTPPEVLEFLRDCFAFRIGERYGSTEIGGITHGNRVERGNVADFRLRDVPELGYRATDRPFPRGELLVKPRSRPPVYFNDPETTARLVDADGYFATGDIVEDRGGDELVWLERVSDVLKLSQGEFVSIGRLEALFERSPLVRQIFLHGEGSRSFLVAVVVPDLAAARERLGREPDPAELEGLVRSALGEAGRAAGLKAFEQPRGMILESEPFSVENGLLSGLRKRRRAEFRRRYGERLHALYTDIEVTQEANRRGLAQAAPTLDPGAQVRGALAATLGLGSSAIAGGSSFAELGGDSFDAIGFSLLVEEMTGVRLPVSEILGPAGNPERWAAMIGTARDRPAVAAEAERPTAARLLTAGDLAPLLDLDRSAIGVSSPAPDPHPMVLLTGATGFLGRFLCLEWLERLAATGGTLVCLVRASDDEAARRRLDAVFDGDQALRARFRASAGGLQVLAGTVSEPRLGLTPATFERLGREAGRIVHAAALVNHALAYEHLFAPNVLGTAELIKLALHTRLKPFDFVSSIAVAPLTLDSGDERSDLKDAILGGSGYAAGYSASKWAGETLLKEAHRRFGLVVNVFRPSMILAHPAYAGQINGPDSFTRLISSIVVTGIAPASFTAEAANRRGAGHYDGLPVDFLAAAIAGIGALPGSESGFRNWNLVNSHVEDDVSLDRIIDWVAASGRPIERVADYSEWLRRFEATLRRLPAERRRHSFLGLLDSIRQPRRGAPPPAARNLERGAAQSLGLAVPHLTESFIRKCLDDMRRLGLID